jgi:hypothetical protein|tara:strand:- start:845 stop:1024 length:180 start_codon:yes stop_codon:yes gene_type:complete
MKNITDQIHDVSYDSKIVPRGDETELAYFVNYLDKDGNILKCKEISQDEWEAVTAGLEV